jgi:hypothetical protein
MARDLIPPPSPAGRPAPDPEQPPPLPADAGASDAQAPAGPPGPSPFRARFGFVTGVLAGCALAAAALLIVLLGSDGSDRKRTAAGGDDGLAANWSPWHPRKRDAIGGAQEIADKIGRTYKDAKAKKLAKVKGGPIALGSLPIAVAIPSAGDRFTIVQGIGVQYTLGGFGKEGRLEGSAPSAERRRLLRREALELSLYSFRYLKEVTMVVALLPPAPRAEQVHPKKLKKGAKPEQYQRQALFFRPGDLRKQLEQPLAATMATTAPSIDGVARDEAKRIDKLTLPNLFTYEHIQQQDGSIYLVLDRPT